MTVPEPTSQCKEEDISLIQRSLQGSDDAFELLYNRYRLPLYSYLHRLLADHSEQVDDFFQQTWLKAVRSLKSYNHQEKFLAWLCRIGHNLAMDYFRSHASDATSELSETLSSPFAPPDRAIQHSELETALQKAILELPPEQQEVIRLRNEGIPFAQIAERQNVGLNTALGRMHYAILNLKKKLAEYL